MNKITEITRRDIANLFRDGYAQYDFLGNPQSNVFYPYCGRLTEIDFLKKIYPLDKMPSYDSRFENAEGDIWQHTVNNNDWEFGWVFQDDRFELSKGNDVVLLTFLCAVFNPENRDENEYWLDFFERINSLIKVDGYELYENSKISGRSVYSWRELTPEESVTGRLVPFSVRNKKALKAKNITLPSIPKKIRAEIVKLFNQYDETLHDTDETGYNYSFSIKESTLGNIKTYYEPKAFDVSKNYSETDNIDLFVTNNYPHCVFDAIELFAQYNRQNKFADEINLLLQNGGFAYKLLGGKMETAQANIQTKEVIKEAGLKELINQATAYYNSNNIANKQIAVEKLWDALERLKTYYDSNKKVSVAKIITEMANNNDTYADLFDKEFLELTAIGNNYRIRHHEIDKTEIIESNYYDYFFQRCFALVELALKYLK